MNDDLSLAYVRASAALLDLPLDRAQAERVAVYLARTAVMAAELDAGPLGHADEPAALYCPAPFPETATQGAAGLAAQDGTMPPGPPVPLPGTRP